MSLKLMVSVFKLDLSATEKIVLLALADHAHDDGRRVYPSVALLMRKTSLSRRGVQNVLRSLEKQNVITPIGTVAGGRGVTVEYKIELGTENGARDARFRFCKRRTPQPKRAQTTTGNSAHRAPESPLTVIEPPADDVAVSACRVVERDSTLEECSREDRRHLPYSPIVADDEKSHLVIDVQKGSQNEIQTREQFRDRRYSDRVDQFREQILSDFLAAGHERTFLNLALDAVDQRAWDCGTRISSPAYFAAALSNILCDSKEVARLREMHRRGRRSHVDVDLTNPVLSEESERAREKFNLRVSKRWAETFQTL